MNLARTVVASALIVGSGAVSTAAAASTTLCGALVQSGQAEAVAAADLPFDPSDLDPVSIEAHNDLIGAAAGVCGWETIPVSSYEWGFDGLEDGLLAATVVFALDNIEGAEPHNLWIYEVSPEAADLSIIEILEDRPDLLTPKGQTPIALPGATDILSNAVELTPGRWAAVCQVPEGTTSATLTEIMETGVLPEGGDPHWRTYEQAVDFWVEE